MIQITYQSWYTALILTNSRAKREKLEISVTSKDRFVNAVGTLIIRRRTAYCFYLILAIITRVKASIFTMVLVVVLLATEGITFVGAANMMKQGALIFVYADLALCLEALPAIQDAEV